MIDNPAALLLLIAAIAAVPLLLRRQRAQRPDGLRVLGRTALTKGAVVAVVAVGERRLLLGAGERGVQLLCELDPAVDGADDLGLADLHLDADPDVAVDLDLAALVATDAASLGRRDAVGTTTAGPRTGLVDRLRVMTVRTPTQGRPFRVPHRR